MSRCALHGAAFSNSKITTMQLLQQDIGSYSLSCDPLTLTATCYEQPNLYPHISTWISYQPVAKCVRTCHATSGALAPDGTPKHSQIISYHIISYHIIWRSKLFQCFVQQKRLLNELRVRLRLHPVSPLCPMSPLWHQMFRASAEARTLFPPCLLKSSIWAKFLRLAISLSEKI